MAENTVNNISISVGIDDRFRNLIRNLGDITAQKKVYSKGVTNVALLLDRESAIKTPIDKGILRASQRALISNNLTARITNDTPYSIPVHEGTKFQRSQPWMREAIDENEKQINTVFNRGIEIYYGNLTSNT